HENPDNPDNPAQPVHRANTMQNQQDAATPGAPGDARTFFSAPDKAPSAPTTPAAPSAPRVESPFEAAPPNPAHPGSATSSPTASGPHHSEPVPSEPTPSGASSAFSHPSLNPYFLHRHESPAAFEALLASHIRTYAPATPAEELLVFRITQKAWLLRRLETWERVIADSHVTRVRERHPNTPAPACIALSLLEAKETASTRFHHRTARLRQEHEAALDRLESKLFRHQQRREARETQTDLRYRPSVQTPVTNARSWPKLGGRLR
ncbi:MAG: hypothetical protein KJZ70_11840, partial [Bryobacterales bacterium]|nr:hypothetical protein [Bryobacterales bacterium]